MTLTRSALFCLGLLLASCEPSQEQQVAALQQEVITLHDSAMAKMDDLARREKHLSQVLDSAASAAPPARHAVAGALQAVQSADEAMWQWMRAYKPDRRKPEEKMPYLLREKEKIQRVWHTMEQSLLLADSVANLYKQNQL